MAIEAETDGQKEREWGNGDGWLVATSTHPGEPGRQASQPARGKAKGTSSDPLSA